MGPTDSHYLAAKYAWRRFRIAALVGLVGVVLDGCADGRSTAAVCDVWESQGVALGDHYGDAASRPPADGAQAFLGLLDVATAPGRLGLLMTKMDDVAPKEVEPAFRQLADTFNSAGKSASDPLSALAGSLGAALGSQGAYEEVNRFITDNCETPKGRA